MTTWMRLLFGGIFFCMIVVTVRSSLAEPLWDAIPGLMANPWAVTTLWDAYCGFLTFYVWVVYKESSTISRAVWFLLIMSLGNIAMSAYILLQLRRLKPGHGMERLLLREAA